MVYVNFIFQQLIVNFNRFKTTYSLVFLLRKACRSGFEREIHYNSTLIHVYIEYNFILI